MFEILKKIIRLVRIFNKKNFFKIIFLSFLLILLEVLSVVSLLPLIDTLVSNNTKYISYFSNEKINIFFFNKEIIIFAIFILFALRSIIIVISNFLIANFKMNLQKNLSKSILRVYLNYDYINFIKMKRSDLIQNITKETEIFVNAFEALIRIFVELLVLIFIIIFIIYNFPKISFVILVFFLSIIYIINFFIKNKLKLWGDLRIQHDKYRIKNLFDAFNLITEIKLLSKEESFVRLFNKNNSITQRTQRNRNLISAIFRTLLEFIIFLILILVLLIQIYNNLDLISIIPIIGFLLVSTFRIMPGFLRINNAYQLIIFSIKSINEINAIFKNSFNLSNKIFIFNNIYLSKKKNTVELKNVNYKYPDNKNFILQNVNLSISSGEIIGIKGASGDGKTTLISILMGLLKPLGGSVNFNNKDINEFISDYKYLIGHVSQTFSIIDASLSQNILLEFDGEEINMKKLNEAIEFSGLKSFVKTLDKELHTELGENGHILSSGQRQRVSIARAIYHSKKIIIFDEAMSSLDKDLENEIFFNIKNYLKDKIVIIISHQDSNLKNCHKIYQLYNSSLKLIE